MRPRRLEVKPIRDAIGTFTTASSDDRFNLWVPQSIVQIFETGIIRSCEVAEPVKHMLAKLYL